MISVSIVAQQWCIPLCECLLLWAMKRTIKLVCINLQDSLIYSFCCVDTANCLSDT